MHKKHPHRQNPNRQVPPPGIQHAAPGAKPTHWAEVADWYDQLVGDQGSEYHQHVIIPGILRLLNIHEKSDTPLNILDLACGQGVLCRKLASLGCHVTGLDAAPPLIEAAQKRNAIDRLPIHYHLADATKLLGGGPPRPQDSRLRTQDFAITPDSFDAVTCILAIQNMTPLSPIWQAIHTALKPKGSLVVVMMHPCFRVPRQSDWHWNEKLGQQGRVIYEYLMSSKINIQTHPGLTAHGKTSPSTVHFHRPLQAYINTLGNAGLFLDHIEEWTSHKKSEPGPKQAALDHSRNQIPLFLALRARKLGSSPPI